MGSPAGFNGDSFPQCFPSTAYNRTLMDRFIVVHYNELGLKKGNRDFFENKLCNNISRTLADCGVRAVRRISGRLLVHFTSDVDMPEI